MGLCFSRADHPVNKAADGVQDGKPQGLPPVKCRGLKVVCRCM